MFAKYRTYREMPSKYLTDELFDKIQTTEFDPNIIKPSNDMFNLSKMMLESEAKKKLSFVNEGLSRTYPTSKFIEWYYEYTKANLPSELQHILLKWAVDDTSQYYEYDLRDFEIYKLAFYQWRDSYKENRVDCYAKKPCDKSLISNFVVCFIPAYKTDDFKNNFLNKLIDESYVYGYNLSDIERIETNIEDVVLYKVQFEAKYPVDKFELNENLYHVTFYSNLSKIKRNGLLPRSNSLAFTYPDRTYLFNVDDTKLIVDYFLHKQRLIKNANLNKSNDSKFCILKINKQNVLNSNLFKTGKLTFYVDGCFTYFDNATAVFTYNGIPANLIDDYCMVYDIYENDTISSGEAFKFK